MEAVEVFQQLIGRYIAPELNRHGYRSSGPTFFMLRRGNWGLVNIQMAPAVDRQSVEFTINLAIVSGRLRAFYYPERTAGRPAPSEGDYQQRIGFLLPEGRDLWWTVDGGTDLDRLGPEIQGYVADLVVPTLDAYLDDRTLYELWRSGRSPGLSDAMRRQNMDLLGGLLGVPS